MPSPIRGRAPPPLRAPTSPPPVPLPIDITVTFAFAVSVTVVMTVAVISVVSFGATTRGASRTLTITT
jgi:hypothetical protein